MTEAGGEEFGQRLLPPLFLGLLRLPLAAH
jgi:hypothetical protein